LTRIGVVKNFVIVVTILTSLQSKAWSKSISEPSKMSKRANLSFSNWMLHLIIQQGMSGAGRSIWQLHCVGII
jgi:hypothetical protein